MRTNHRKSLVLLLSLTLLAFGALAACDSDSSDDEAGLDVVTGDEDVEEEDPLAEMVGDACVHLQTGPFEAVTAAADAAGAPEITPGHLVNEVTLMDGAGFLTLTVEEHGEFLVASSTVVTLALTDAEGAAVEPEASPDVSGECAAIATAHVFHIEEGSYILSLTADSAITDFDLFVGHMGDHEHEHESE